jgi:hypothetical protein
VLAGAITGMSVYGVEVMQMDKHIWDTPKSKASNGGLIAWILEVLFLAAMTLTKVSVLLFFRRLVDRSFNKWITYAIWLAVAFTIAYFFAFTLFLVLACTPVEASWKSLNLMWKRPYHCVDRELVDTLVGALSVFSDLYAMLIPIYIVSKLKMQLSRKIVLYGVFCCGLVVIGAGIARTYYLSRLTTDPRRDLTCKSCDALLFLSRRKLIIMQGVGLNGMIWGQLELELALICASAPAMRGFLSAVAERVTTAYGSNKYGSQSRGTAATKLSNFSGRSVKRGTQVFDGGVSTFDHGIPMSRAGWTEKSEFVTRKSSDEFLTAPERKFTLQKGIMVTESFSVERHGLEHDIENQRPPERL